MEEEMLEDYQTIKISLLERKFIIEKRLVKEKEELRKNESKMSKTDLRTTKLVIIGINHELEQIRGKLEYLRPAIDKDKEYRLRQCETFQNNIRELVPDNLPFRFHGCPIYTADQIIKSREIISSVDRIGFKTSYDEDKEISVTTKKDVGASVRGYANLKNYYCLPAGCIFVLFPENEGDALLSENKSTINNVNFGEDPKRLYAILTTPENIERVKRWCQESGVNSEKVKDFDGFVEMLKDKEIIQDAIRTWQDIKSKNNKGDMINTSKTKNFDDEER